ncbi:alpha/beta hydrolase family protein [Aeromonas dhakensis]|uniref:alpha/beta hydrolase family protein n=1 Tax=Aeromonas dhakensis TaxID=196024 RepID=UPI003BA3BDC9
MIELESKKLSPEHQGIFKLHDSNCYHNVYINCNDSESLFVFFQGAVDKSKPQPNFQRISWSDRVPGNLMILTDPTVDNNSLTIGWCQYSPKVNYFYRTAELIKNYAISIGVNEERIFLYGSSAGGFAALMVAAYFNNATVIANNPQTDWTMFYKNKVAEVLNIIYGGLTPNEYKNTFPNRFNVGMVYKNIGRVPNIFYLQNVDDEFHYVNHYLPLLEFVIKNKLGMPNFHSILYSSKIEGHNPRSIEDTLKVINMAMNK